MGLFGRSRKQGDEIEDAEGVEVAPSDEEHDPSSWALPADAAVAAGAATIDQEPVAEPAAGELPGSPEPEPAAAQGGDAPSVAADDERRHFAQPPGPGASTAAGGGPAASAAGGPAENPTFEQRPELVVAGAFAGAFVVARILRRIAE